MACADFSFTTLDHHNECKVAMEKRRKESLSEVADCLIYALRNNYGTLYLTLVPEDMNKVVYETKIRLDFTDPANPKVWVA